MHGVSFFCVIGNSFPMTQKRSAWMRSTFLFYVAGGLAIRYPEDVMYVPKHVFDERSNR